MVDEAAICSGGACGCVCEPGGAVQAARARTAHVVRERGGHGAHGEGGGGDGVVGEAGLAERAPVEGAANEQLWQLRLQRVLDAGAGRGRANGGDVQVLLQHGGGGGAREDEAARGSLGHVGFVVAHGGGAAQLNRAEVGGAEHVARQEHVGCAALAGLRRHAGGAEAGGGSSAERGGAQQLGSVRAAHDDHALADDEDGDDRIALAGQHVAVVVHGGAKLGAEFTHAGVGQLGESGDPPHGALQEGGVEGGGEVAHNLLHLLRGQVQHGGVRCRHQEARHQLLADEGLLADEVALLQHRL